MKRPFVTASSRRRFLALATTSLGALAIPLRGAAGNRIRFGLVTYMWGADWDLETLIRNCGTAGVSGVELRVDHAHKVDPSLSGPARAAVKAQFADSPVTLLGMGTNFEFHSADPAVVRKNLDGAREFVRLSHDIGGTGVKVKPNALPKEVPKEKTLNQIGRALAELGRDAADFGQEIRLEVHGGVTDLGDIRTVMATAATLNVRVCWNSNQPDLAGDGLEANFAKVKEYLGHTIHVREVPAPDYPYAALAKLLVKADYDGYVCLEASSKPADRVGALTAQRIAWDDLVRAASGN